MNKLCVSGMLYGALAVGVVGLAGCDKKEPVSETTPSTGAAVPAKATPAVAPAAAAATGSAALVRNALKGGGIQFTEKDKTAVAKTLLDPSAVGDLVALTEFKFEGNSVILLVAEAKDAASAPRLGSYLSPFVDKVKTADAKYTSAGVGGLNDPKSAVYILKKDSDGPAGQKILGLISK